MDVWWVHEWVAGWMDIFNIFYFINNHTAWVVKGTMNLELKV